jgi:hypothetical protein
MSTVPVRTITFGLADPHPLSAQSIRHVAIALAQARGRFHAEGYEVQTVRLSTRPVLDDLADWPAHNLLRYVHELQTMLVDNSLEYCSLGPAQALRHDFSLARLDLLADMLIVAPVVSATVQFAGASNGHLMFRHEAALPTARLIQRLAQETAEGFGNFRFAMLACVDPGSPFFPAAYHSPTAVSQLSIGLQAASIIADALHSYHENMATREPDLAQITQHVSAEFSRRKAPYADLAQKTAQELGLVYGGMDYSPAPMGEDSIVAAIEQAGYGTFGSSGTLALVAALTAVLKGLSPQSAGYNGLMFPVLEDAALGRRWEEGLVTAQQLLLYSSVCGTGLDTIPIAGDTPTETIARLLVDVATLAYRLHKPLSARLFPVPGKRAGERTAFTSPYLTNTVVQGI